MQSCSHHGDMFNIKKWFIVNSHYDLHLSVLVALTLLISFVS